jgi:hypothetical protein
MLPKLEEMGLIEKIVGKPTKIRATPVEEAISFLIKHEEDASREKVSALKAKAKTFLAHFARTPRLEVEEKANFALLSKRESMIGKILIMLKRAEREFDIACSGGKLVQFMHIFSEQLDRARKRGVRIRIISELGEYGEYLPKAIERQVSPANSIDLRCTDLPASHYMIVDFEEALISTTTEGNMGENPWLWTNSDSLVGVFQGDFENLWHASVSWKYVETTAVPEKMVQFMEQLRPKNHLVFAYDSPEAKYNVLFNYLKVGLENGEAGVYVAADENPNQIRNAMKQFGIEVEKHEKTHALKILGYEDIYIIDGNFSMTTTLNSWKKLYNEALKQGFKGLRVTGEMACFFKHNMIRELIEYEKTLHRVLDIPMIAICAYNADMLNKTNDPINLYTELARAHRTVLFTGLDAKLGRMEIRKV